MFVEETQPLIDDFIKFYNDRGQFSEATTTKWAFVYFIRFMVSQRPYVRCISDLHRKDIETFLSYLWGVEYNENGNVAHQNRNNFVYRILRALHKFFEYLVINEDVVGANNAPKPDLIHKADFPSPHRRGVKHFPVWLDKLVIEEIRSMSEAKAKDLKFKTMMMFLYFVGARALDIVTLERNCCFTKLGFNWIRIYSNKTRLFYDIPISTELKTCLDKYLDATDGYTGIHPGTNKSTVFMFLHAVDADNFKITFSRKIKIFMEKVREKAKEIGLPVINIAELALTSHKFRHTVAIRLIRMGADPMLVAEFLGHKDLSMAQAYIQESEEEIDLIMSELWEDDALGLTDDLIGDIEISRDDVLRYKGAVSKTECGWCTHIDGKPPCGEGAYDCWQCDSLKPDLKDNEYLDRLHVHLVDHQMLLERNIKFGYLGAAKAEEAVISRIHGFIAEVNMQGGV